jgi:hypothetical protein
MTEQLLLEPALPHQDQVTPVADLSTDGAKLPGVDGEYLPRWELASPYAPDDHEDPRGFAHAMLTTAREVYAEDYATHPGLYTGLVVYGSLIKGRAHANSDIDGCVLINPDSPSFQLMGGYKTVAGHVTGLKDRIDERLAERGIASDDIRRARIRHINCSERILDTAISDVEKQAEYGKNTLHIPDELFVPFMMRVGPGDIKNVRQHIIQKLSGVQHGERIWYEIAQTLVDYEEKRRDAAIDFPVTLADAADYFDLAPPDAANKRQMPAARRTMDKVLAEAGIIQAA